MKALEALLAFAPLKIGVSERDDDGAPIGFDIHLQDEWGDFDAEPWIHGDAEELARVLVERAEERHAGALTSQA